jgi:hypothetical protein
MPSSRAILERMETKRRTYAVTVRPCTKDPGRFRWQVTSSDGTHTEFSPQSFPTESAAMVAGQAKAGELERIGYTEP